MAPEHECKNESRIKRNERDIQALWGPDGIRGIRDEMRSDQKMKISQLVLTILTLVGIVAKFFFN